MKMDIFVVWMVTAKQSLFGIVDVMTTTFTAITIALTFLCRYRILRKRIYSQIDGNRQCIARRRSERLKWSICEDSDRLFIPSFAETSRI